MRTLLLLTLFSTACGSGQLQNSLLGVKQASSNYASAQENWDAYQTEKVRVAKAGYDAGMALHTAYMATKPPADATMQTWFTQQNELLSAIHAQFEPVIYSDFKDKAMLTCTREGEAWEKLVIELDAIGGKQTVFLSMALDGTQQGFEEALYYFGDDGYPELRKHHPDVYAYLKKHKLIADARRAKLLAGPH